MIFSGEKRKKENSLPSDPTTVIGVVSVPPHSAATSVPILYSVPAQPPGQGSSHPTAVYTVGTAAGQALQPRETVTTVIHMGRMHVEQTDVVDVMVGQAWAAALERLEVS
jgi:hypothetical protein